jgi:hypothetical protein
VNDQTLETLRVGTAARCRRLTGWGKWCSGIAVMALLGEGAGEVKARRIAIVWVFRQRLSEHSVEVREIGPALRQPRRRRAEMVTDDDSAIRVLKGWRTGQQMKSRGRQRILISPAV